MNLRKYLGGKNVPHPPSHIGDDAEIKALRAAESSADRLNKMALEVRWSREKRQNGGTKSPAT